MNSKLLLGRLAAEDVGNLAAQSLEDVDRLRWPECLGCALSLGPNFLDSSGVPAGQNHGGDGLNVDWDRHHHLWWNYTIGWLGIGGRLDTSSGSRLGSNLLGRGGLIVGGLISDGARIIDPGLEDLAIICDVYISCTVHHRQNRFVDLPDWMWNISPPFPLPFPLPVRRVVEPDEFPEAPAPGAARCWGAL
jgi:hypothetical protein